MRISWKLINKYVCIDHISKEILINDLFLMGFEVESYIDQRFIKDFVVGEIINFEKHPNANKLSICQVKIQKNKIETIVCGANNLVKNRKVIVALPGATLPNKIKIAKREIRGIESNGMICSLSELGIDEKFQTKDDLEGIHLINSDDLKIGSNGLEYLNLNDLILDISFTNDRSNALGIYYFAKEIAEYYDLKMKPLEIEENFENIIENDIHVDIKTNECLNFAWLKINRAKIGKSPEWLTRYLYNANIRSINNVVDITNLILVELNQSMHAYDLDFTGNKISIEKSSSKKQVKVLDDSTQCVDELVVVKNSNNVLSLGGIIGCLNGSIQTGITKNIFLEAAIWKPTYIRKAINKTKISTQSGASSSKKLSDYNMTLALKRFIFLAKKINILDKYSDINIYKKLSSPRKLEINIVDVEKICGFKIEHKNLVKILLRKFKISDDGSTIIVTIPSYRNDLVCKEDLTNEVMKIWGVNRICENKIKTTLEKTNHDTYLEDKFKISHYLSNIGFNEVKTYSIVDNKGESEFNFYDNPVLISNPIDIDKKYYRCNLITSLFNTFLYNDFRKCKNINIFEISKIYNFNSKKIQENSHVAFLLSQGLFNDVITKNSVLPIVNNAKEISKRILSAIGLDSNNVQFKPGNYTCDSVFNENSVNIYHNNVKIGTIITINSKILIQKKSRAEDVVICEMQIGNLTKIKEKNVINSFKMQPVIKDLSFSVNKNVDKSKIIKYITSFENISNCYIFDYYKKLNNESIGFRITIEQNNVNLDKEKIKLILNEIVSKTEKKFNVKIN